MTALIAIVLLLIAMFFVWRIFKVASRLRPTAEPPDEIDVREPVPGRPLNRSGAVALEYPKDNDSDTDAYSRR